MSQVSFTPADGDWEMFKAWCELHGFKVQLGFSAVIEKYIKPDLRRLMIERGLNVQFDFVPGEVPKMTFTPSAENPSED